MTESAAAPAEAADTPDRWQELTGADAQQVAADTVGFQKQRDRSEVRRQRRRLVALTGSGMNEHRSRRRDACGIAERLVREEDPLAPNLPPAAWAAILDPP